MCCAQVRPDATVLSSQAGSQPSNVDHSVSQAGLDQPPSGVVGAEVYPWLVNTEVSACAVESASIAAAYCWAKSQPSVAQHSILTGSPEDARVGPSVSRKFAVCDGLICMLS